MTFRRLPSPPSERHAVVAWVAEHLAGLYEGPSVASPVFIGGQRAADAALAAFDVAGYAARRNEVLPEGRRGASGLSPYIRHGLLPLETVWDAVGSGPARDAAKFRDELLWQEYARHLYARLGRRTAAPLRAVSRGGGSLLPPDMACVNFVDGELERNGWLVNQTRMWRASHWVLREGRDLAEGEEWFFRHLLDGSRAANRLGWQWTAGSATGRPYGFSRRQVERRAPELCRACPHRTACPIEEWPDHEVIPLDADPLLRRDPNLAATAGPAAPLLTDAADVVWLTAESLGTSDAALAAHPELPAVFVFDEPLLRRLRLTAKRLVFLAECLADLSTNHALGVYRGAPAAVLADRRPAVTFAPVPGFRTLAERLQPAEVHPWPWLVPPHDRSVASFSAWRKHAAAPD